EGNMATRKRSNGSRKGGSGTPTRKISRRALISGLGGGLALPAFGSEGKKGGSESNPFSAPPDYRTAVAQRKFTASDVSRIIVDSKDFQITYQGIDYHIQDNYKITLIMKAGKGQSTVDMDCYRFTPGPSPGTGKKS